MYDRVAVDLLYLDCYKGLKSNSFSNMSAKYVVVKALKNPSLAFHKLKRKLENEIEDVVRTRSQRHIWSEVVNQKEIRIVGLRRTGNHAIITWIQEQENGEVWHLNNLKIKTNPYRYKFQHLRDFYPQHQWSINRYQKEAKGDFTSKDCLLYSYEDYELEQIFNNHFEKKHDLYLGKSLKRYDLIILRDPFNLLASRIKKNYISVQASNKTFIELWIAYAKEFLGETQYLKNKKICVNYNQWHSDIDYRQQIAKHLELDFSDAGISKVHGCGGGSSFEGCDLDGQAHKMDVHNRWKFFVDDISYRKLLDNEELLEYSERIFGHIQGTEVLRIR